MIFLRATRRVTVYECLRLLAINTIQYNALCSDFIILQIFGVSGSMYTTIL